MSRPHARAIPSLKSWPGANKRRPPAGFRPRRKLVPPKGRLSFITPPPLWFLLPPFFSSRPRPLGILPSPATSRAAQRREAKGEAELANYDIRADKDAR